MNSTTLDAVNGTAAVAMKVPPWWVRAFRVSPEIGHDAAGAPRIVWGGMVAIDLRWVASIEPRLTEISNPTLGANTCIVVLCGSDRGNGYHIDACYEDLMPLWLAAKGLQ